MLTLPSDIKVWVAAEPVDMRKGCYSLAALVQKEFNLDPKSSHLFAFFSKRSNKVKVLYWDRNGFALWSKHLAEGKFRTPRATTKRYTVSISDFTLLLEGIDLTHKQRLKAI